jgi:Domain of unknown function (DUF4410)
MVEGLYHRLFLNVALVVLSGGVGSCSFSINATTLEPPPPDISVIAIGGMEADDPDRDRIARRFRRTLVTSLQETEAFTRVVCPPPPRVTIDTVVITGRFVEVDDGSELLRFGLGLGAGSPSLRARFEMKDSAGRVLAAFEEDARSFERTGYAAHWNPADVDTLADDLAVNTAEAIARWRRGEELAGSIW